MTTATLDTTHQHGQQVTPAPTPNQNAELATVHQAKAPVLIGQRGLELRDLEGLYRFANAVARSGFAPKGMQSPEAILVAVQLGLEIGMTPMAALQNIAVINGRPGVYGDAALALVQSSGLLETFKEEEVGEPDKDSWGCRVTVKRRGRDAAAETFTVADAKRANLWGKEGPWRQYPRRMLKFRARSFALRDNFGDVLKGLHTAEELADTEENRFANAKPVQAAEESPAASKAERLARAARAKVEAEKGVAVPAPAPVTPEAQTPAAAPVDPPSRAEEPEGVPALQQVQDWCEEQGITAHELCAVLRTENVIGGRTHEFHQLADKATALEYVLTHKEEVIKGVTFFRSENRQ